MQIADELKRDGRVDVDAFADAARFGGTVGTCPCGGTCGGSVERVRGMVWLTVVCRSCRAERSSPGGRVLPAPRRPARRAARRPDAAFLAAAADWDRRRLGERDAA